MDSNRFDDLTKALATPNTRRRALRQIGGALTGALLAGGLRVFLSPGRTLAQGNSDCAHFCTSVFPPGPARGKCISDAAHHTGLCYSCGPAAPSNHPPLCGQVCCTCVNGTCYQPCSGQSCGSLEFGCNGNSSCACYTTVEGVGFCSLPQPCTVQIGCTSSTECPFGWACANTCCSGTTVCLQPCRPTQASLPSGQTTHGYL
jgi:hypothetical protein